MSTKFKIPIITIRIGLTRKRTSLRTNQTLIKANSATSDAEAIYHLLCLLLVFILPKITPSYTQTNSIVIAYIVTGISVFYSGKACYSWASIQLSAPQTKPSKRFSITSRNDRYCTHFQNLVSCFDLIPKFISLILLIINDFSKMTDPLYLLSWWQVLISHIQFTRNLFNTVVEMIL